LTISEILEIIEEKLAEAEIKMANPNNDCDYRYMEEQIETLELLREHLEHLEEE